MRSQSYRSYLPIAPSLVGQSPATARPIPSVLYWLVALAVASSFYVAVEPAPTDLVFLVLLGAVLFDRGTRLPIDLNPILGVAVLAYFAGSVLSLLWSDDVAHALLYWSVTTYLLISWYLIVTLLANYGAPMWQLIQRAFLIAALLSALIGLISHFSTVLQDYLAMQTSYGDRARGAFKDPNVYSPFLCAALLLIINRMITQKILSIVSISLFSLFSLEIIAAFSRGAYVNLILSLFIFFGLHLFVMFRRDWLARSLILLIVGTLGVLLVGYVFLEVSGLDDFLRHRLRLQEYDAKRFATQSLALDSIGKAPFGVGPGQSDPILGYSPHNLFLRVAVENGVIAALAFYLFLATTLWICLRGAWRRGPFRDLYATCLAILAGILVNSMVIDSLHWRHFFLFLAVPAGLMHHELWVSRAARAAVPAVRRDVRAQPT